MKDGWNRKLISLQKFSMFNFLPEVYIGKLTYEYSFPIYFCPWCGEEITCREVERVRKVKKERLVTETKTVVEYEEIPEPIKQFLW